MYTSLSKIIKWDLIGGWQYPLYSEDRKKYNINIYLVKIRKRLERIQKMNEVQCPQHIIENEVHLLTETVAKLKKLALET